MLPLPVESVSPEVADKPERPKAKTPEQLAKMLAKACRGISKALVIVVLDIDERFIMTGAEARSIADPASRILMRIKALRKPIKWVTGNSDELDLLIALGKYSMRLVDPVSMKIALLREKTRMQKQMEGPGINVRSNVPPSAAVGPGNPGGSGPGPTSNGARPGAAAGIDFAGYQSESPEAQSFIIPGVGWGFSQ